MAFARIEPFGPRMDNYRTGVIASTVANFSQISSKHDYRPKDFAPRVEKPLTLAQKIAKAFGAQIED